MFISLDFFVVGLLHYLSIELIKQKVKVDDKRAFHKKLFDNILLQWNTTYILRHTDIFLKFNKLHRLCRKQQNKNLEKSYLSTKNYKNYDYSFFGEGILCSSKFNF